MEIGKKESVPEGAGLLYKKQKEIEKDEVFQLRNGKSGKRRIL